MKKILLTIGLLLTFTFANCQLAGIIASQDANCPTYGAEKITNGEFADATGWAVSAANWAISGDNATYDDAGNANIWQLQTSMVTGIETGTKYVLTLDITIASGNAYMRLSPYSGGDVYVDYANYANGSHEVVFTTSEDIGLGGFMIRATTTSTTSFSIDNISLREDYR